MTLTPKGRRLLGGADPVWRWPGLTEPSARTSRLRNLAITRLSSRRKGRRLINNKIGFAPLGPVRSRCQATSRLYRSFCGRIPRLRRPKGERNSRTRSRPCAALVRWASSFMMKPRQPVEVPVPTVRHDNISIWFNRAVVNSQSFSTKFPDPVSGHHIQINSLDGTRGIAWKLVMPVS
jgi:hypothetical protein